MQSEVILVLSLSFYFYIPVTYLWKTIIAILLYKNKYPHNGREKYQITQCILQINEIVYSTPFIIVFLRIMVLDTRDQSFIFIS